MIFCWISFYAGLSSHYWWKISWKITFWWLQGSGKKNKIPFNDQANVADIYLWSLLPLDKPKAPKHKNTLDEFNGRSLEMLLKIAFLKNLVNFSEKWSSYSKIGSPTNMFLWIFSKYSKQPFYRAVPDGCLSANWMKIIWISNHAFSPARQRVLYYDRPVYFWSQVYWKGPMNLAQSVCSSVRP